MTVYTCLITKETFAGGVWFYAVVFMGRHLKKLDANNPKELGQKLFEYFQNCNLENDAQVDIEFPQRLHAGLNMREGGGDSLFVPIREAEAQKILTEYYLFKSEVHAKRREDARKDTST